MNSLVTVKRTARFALAPLLFAGALAAGAAQRDEENAWRKLTVLAQETIRDSGVTNPPPVLEKIDALVELHAEFTREVLGKPVQPERRLSAKEGVELFLREAADKFGPERSASVLRLLRELAENRAVFIDLFAADHTAEMVRQQLLAYLARNQTLGYTNPVPIPAQVMVPRADTPLRIVAEDVRLISDQGTAGHLNRAVDAGEMITLNVPLQNFSGQPFRSTSALLETADAFVRANVAKVVYTERSVVAGETVTFAPGTTNTPRQHYHFSLSPRCPDGHEIAFNLHVGDSDYGEFFVPFKLRVHHVGPVEFGAVKIDDDRFGDSDGNNDRNLDPGETVEYLLPLRNAGLVEVTNLTAVLFCDDTNVVFKAGYKTNHYKLVPPQSERLIPASFVFTLQENAEEELPDTLPLRLLTRGAARGLNYSWLQTQIQPIGAAGERKPRRPAITLHDAAAKGDLAAVISHLMWEADINGETNQLTPLFLAAASNRLEVAKYLLEHKANPNQKAEKSGMTPLHVAAQQGSTNLARLLFAHQADTNARDNFGFTPLHTAAEAGQIELARMFLERGADVNAEATTTILNLRGATPLHLAAQNGHLPLVKLLLAASAKVDPQQMDGATPLALAGAADRVDIAAALLARGANANVKYQKEWTPLKAALKNGKSQELVQLLRKHGAKE